MTAARTMTPAAHYAEAEKFLTLAEAAREIAGATEEFTGYVELAKAHAALAAVPERVWPDVALYHDPDVTRVSKRQPDPERGEA
jgi:hypothetical protein